MASIIYAVIASDSNPTPLAEVSLAEGNFGMLALKLLTKIRKDNSASYVYENKYIFHYNNQNDVTFLCMTDAAFHNRTAYAFLFDIKEKFFEKFGTNVKNLPGYGANREFSELMTKDIMIENIDKVLARGEKIELLVNKTQQLSDSSVSMRKTVMDS